jgi:hypothetical protein
MVAGEGPAEADTFQEQARGNFLKAAYPGYQIGIKGLGGINQGKG